MPRPTFLRLVPALPLVVLGLAACGGSDDPEQADAPVTQAPQTSIRETPTVTTPTVTTPPATTTTPPQQPPATTPTTPPDNGGTPATTPTTPADPGGAQAPTQDDPPAQTTPPSDQTGGSATPVDCGQAVGGFIKGISATGTECGAATGVAGAWYDAVNQGTPPDAAIEAAGYSCSGSMSGQRTDVSCTGGDGVQVTFSASP